MTSAPQTLPGSATIAETRWVWLAGLCLALEVLKLGLLLACGQWQPWGDSGAYWALSSQAVQGDWWFTQNPVAYRTPGYLWYLAVCRLLFGSYGLLAAVVGQQLCVIGTSVLTVHAVYLLTKSTRVAFVTWGLCLLSTARPLYANWLLTEAPATFCLIATVWCLIQALLTENGRWLLLGGAVLGLGVLLRPAIIVGVPLLLLTGFWLSRALPQTPRDRVLLLLGGPLVFLALLTPWCLRNQRLFDRFTLCMFTGRELWTAHFSPWPGGALELPAGPALAALQQRVEVDRIDWRHQWTVSNRLRDSGLNDAETDRLMEQIATQAIARQPRQALLRTLARCGTFWYCWEWETDLQGPDVFFETHYPAQQRFVMPAIRDIVTAALRSTPERWRVTSVLWSLLTWVGIIRLVSNRAARRLGLWLGLLLATATLLTAVLEIPLYRYRCVLEPVMLIAIVVPGSLRPDLPTALRPVERNE